ncbi:MAG: 2-oxo acid dehydrogenase subunit E2 [Alphaproteobacteria bacterium]|nr:2-oxo acid dehydrogenase subunit E2 [Alphaproteobacteria bacterium]
MSEFRMPSLGADMEAGTLVEWLKKPGDRVAPGDVVAVVETQKGAIEIEIFEGGIIERLIAKVGETLPVGSPLAIIAGSQPSSVPQAGQTAPEVEPERPAPPPVETVTETAATAQRGIRASPAARKLAADHHVDLEALTGSGPEGAIVYVDVENWLHAAARQPASPPGTSPPPPARRGREAMREAIGATMARAKREIPHYYLQHTFEFDRALDWLSRTNAALGPDRRLVPGTLLVKALALACREFADFNGYWRDGHFEASQSVNVGTAIAIPGGGLVAPAIMEADRLELPAVMERLRDLVNRVRAGRYRGSELTGATVTLSSLGERSVEGLWPIINPPQVAIVGAGTPVERPWIRDGRVVPAATLMLTLAADHRVSDGHRGARFLAAIAAKLQEPEKL